jgi:hypothetical protein
MKASFNVEFKSLDRAVHGTVLTEGKGGKLICPIAEGIRPESFSASL